jgi:alpha-beta hydrolase superfamily lysophospholipase
MSMHRPVMDITYLDDAPEPTGKRRRVQALRLAGRAVWRFIRLIGRVLAYDPLASTPFGRFRNEDGSPLSRFVRGVAYRLAFVPIFAALLACALVYSATHPVIPPSVIDPASLGVYYEPVALLAEDNVRLEAWHVPAIDARKVIDQREKVLREKHPAVVLVHDFANRRQQMLPLVKPLHEAGFVVMVVGLRGTTNTGGGARLPAGQTFGLREAADVKAAVEHLRRRPSVDPKRVALVGVGAGASASLIHLASDPNIAAAVIEGPADGLDQMLVRHVVPQHEWLRWIKPLCRWTFEIAYEVDGEELSLKRYVKTMANRPVLMLDGDATSEDFGTPVKVEQLREFLVVKTAVASDATVKPKTASAR